VRLAEGNPVKQEGLASKGEMTVFLAKVSNFSDTPALDPNSTIY
jgi:hypothetical protein